MRALIEELEVANLAGGEVFPETEAEIFQRREQ
jgi:hypothetical protein